MCKEKNVHQVFSVNFQQLKMISFGICLIMTGTGIIPGHDFSLRKGDKIKTSIDGMGSW